MKIRLGNLLSSNEKFFLPKRSFETHWHLIGGTGKGKTTAIHTMLHELLLHPMSNDCWFILDRMGNLSHELLLWAVSPFCTDDVRKRIVYIEPAREEAVIGFNPLVYTTPAQGYYKVARSTETILRGWESSDIQAMPRLARWLFNSFWAASQLNLTISDCVHLLNPGSDFHKAILQLLPPLLKAEWSEILHAHGAEAARVLESTRNRLKPYFESEILRRMFGSNRNSLDVHRFMREGRIVLVNLNSRNKLSPQEADAIGGLIINEVLATARGLPAWDRFPTFLLLDEFQRFVGPDLEEALPEVRQLQIRLILAHQSFSQLNRGDYDLTSMIFQAQSRMIFGVQGEDADLLANELASLTYDPKRIKDMLYSRRQWLTGHRIIELESWSESDAAQQSWQKTYGENWGTKKSEKRDAHDFRRTATGKDESSGHTDTKGTGGGTTHTSGRGRHQQLVPEYEEFLELTTKTYYTFDEFARVWGRDIRRRRTGEAFIRLVDDPTIYDVKVRRSMPGHLSMSVPELHESVPEVLDDVEEFIAENFRSEFFMTPRQIDEDRDRRLRELLRPPIQLIIAADADGVPIQTKTPERENPFQ